MNRIRSSSNNDSLFCHSLNACLLYNSTISPSCIKIQIAVKNYLSSSFHSENFCRISSNIVVVMNYVLEQVSDCDDSDALEINAPRILSLFPGSGVISKTQQRQQQAGNGVICKGH